MKLNSTDRQLDKAVAPAFAVATGTYLGNELVAIECDFSRAASCFKNKEARDKFVDLVRKSKLTFENPQFSLESRNAIHSVLKDHGKICFSIKNPIITAVTSIGAGAMAYYLTNYIISSNKIR